MKQLNKIILTLTILVTCVFVNSKLVAAEETLSCTTTLRNGSSGTQVKLLQKELNEVAGCGLGVDGIFGSKTKTCVTNFQSKYKLDIDGIVGKQTCTKLNQLYNEKITKDDETVKEEVTATPKTVNVRSNLNLNAQGEQVTLLQTELKKVAKDLGITCNITINGVYDSNTQKCVKNFQKNRGLTADGIAGINTNSKLNVLYLTNNNYVVVNVSSGTNGGYLNVRAKATTSSTKLGTTSYGTIYQVYGSEKGSDNYIWYKIKFNGNYAYIRSDYTSKNSVVVDISAQTLQLYNNGKLILDTPVITGAKNQYDTPTGRFTLTYKDTTDAEGNKVPLSKYNVFVDYWMPFNGGIGFHDADWRPPQHFYDATTYTRPNSHENGGGSHGCINMLDDAAKTLYSYINSKTNIFVVK